MSRDELIRHMHGVTAGYHQHYSTVRTTATSLVLPLGLVASIEFLSLCATTRIGPWPGVVLVLFVVAVTMYLNLVFTRWSRIARRAERLYEAEMLDARGEASGAAEGFRHRFRRLSGEPEREQAPRETIGLLDRENWRDPFLSGALLFSLLYAAWYVVAAGTACT